MSYKKIENLIQKCCEEKKIIPPNEWRMILAHPILPKNRIGFVYNQLANIHYGLVSEEIEHSLALEAMIQQAFSYHWKKLFQLPEAIYLYTSLLDIQFKTIDISPSFFLYTCHYLTYFSPTYTTAQLDRVGWKIIEALLKDWTLNMADSTLTNIYQLSSQYPDMIALKFWQLLRASLGNYPYSYQTFITLFSYLSLQNNKALVLVHLQQFLLKFFPFTSPNSLPKKEDVAFYLKILERMMTIFSKAIQLHPPSSETTVAIDMISHLLAQAVLFFQKNQEAFNLNTNVLTQFLVTYKTLQHLFEQEEVAAYQQIKQYIQA